MQVAVRNEGGNNKNIQLIKKYYEVKIEDQEIILSLRFYPTIEQWNFDVEFKEKKVLGVKLSLGTLHIVSANLPFDFIVLDGSGEGVDPFKVDDFVTDGRCKLYILDPEDMEEIRGIPVEI